jgi:hypothetical protein
LSNSWRETRGYLERLAGIQTLLFIPFVISRVALRSFWNEWYFPDWGRWSLVWLGNNVSGGIVQVIWYVFFVSAGAIAYRVLFKEGQAQPQSMADTKTTEVRSADAG